MGNESLIGCVLLVPAFSPIRKLSTLEYESTNVMRSRPTRAIWYAVIVALAVSASAAGLANGFALDDGAIVADNARIHSLHQWWQLFGVSYWPPQYGASLYRPFVTLLFAVQWAAGGGAPWVFHLASVALYASLSALVLALLLELIPPVGAYAAAALFAVHPVHVEAVANVVGQSELLAAIAMVGASIIYVRARRRGTLSIGAIASIAALFVLGCLSKEHALLLPGLLVALEMFAIRSTGHSPIARLLARARTTGAVYLVLGVIAIAYLVVRTSVLGDLLGEKHPVPVYGARRLWVMLAVVPHWLRLLAWPAHLSADYSPQQIAIPSGPGLEIVPGLAILIATLVTFVALGLGDGASYQQRRPARLALAWMAVTLLPVTNLFSVMIVEERTLLMPSVGAMLLVGAVVATVWQQQWSVPGRSTVMRACLTSAIAGLVALGAVRSSSRQRVWRDNATLFAQTVEDAPRSYRAQFFYGQMMFAEGKRAEGERHLRLAIDLNPTAADVSPLNYLATQYRDAGMCPQALPLYARALANDAERPDVRYGLASCLLATGRSAEARRLAQDGVRRGDLKSLFLDLIARTDSVGRGGG